MDGTTTITLPYAPTDIDKFALLNARPTDSAGHQLGWNYAITYPDPLNNPRVVVINTVLTEDDDFLGGEDYVSRYEFSRPFLKQEKGRGESSILDGRLQIRYYEIAYSDTPGFTAIVTHQLRHVDKYTVSSRRPNSLGFRLGEMDTAMSGTKRIPCLGKNTEISLALESIGFYPFRFEMAEWMGVYTPKANRRV